MAFVAETWSWKWTQQNIYNPFNLYFKSSQNISLIFFCVHLNILDVYWLLFDVSTFVQYEIFDSTKYKTIEHW